MGGRTSTSWSNGQSGNPGGRPRTKPFADALRMEIKDSLSPTLFMGTDKDAGFLSVVMPMRVD